MQRYHFQIRQKLRAGLGGLVGLVPKHNTKISYIVEPKNWSIKADGMNTVREVKSLVPGFSINVTHRPYFAHSEITHFGSQFMFQKWLDHIDSDSSVAVTYFHGKKGQGLAIDDNLDFLIQNQKKVAKVIVSFTRMKERSSRGVWVRTKLDCQNPGWSFYWCVFAFWFESADQINSTFSWYS